MEFTQAVRTVYGKYATFSGRASRSEYWFFYLFFILVYLACVAVGLVVGIASGDYNTGVVLYSLAYGVFSLASLIPSIAVAVRRMHDTGRSGWNLLWALLPIVGAIVVLVFMVTPSGADNKYGPQPD